MSRLERCAPATTVPALRAERPVPEPTHDARGLTAGGPTARIELDGQVYVLRITRAGKLILTK